jgi:protein-disulfide isomerase
MVVLRRLLVAVVVFPVAALAACTNGAAAQKPAKPDEVLTASAPGARPAADAKVDVKPAAPRSDLTSFPAVDLAGLDAKAVEAFTKIANEEVCPCDCPKSFGACLQEGSQCKPAILLAKWMVSQLNDGFPPERMSETITREIASFSGEPKKIDVAGFASKGAASPKYTVLEFADFECAHCKAAAPSVEELVRKHPDVKVVFKHFPLSFHAMAKKAAIAAEAAGRQGKFWEMHGAIFATQENLSDELLLGHAKALGLDATKFTADLADPALLAKVEASRTEAAGFGVDATPAFFVNGRAYFLSRNVEGFELRMKMEEARASSSCQ